MTSDVTAEIVAAAESLSEAIIANDAVQIATLLSDDWRLVDADGVTTRDEFLDIVESGRLTHSRMQAVGPVDVRVYGDVGVVLARVVNTAHFDGRTFDADEWTTDVFVRSGSGWVCAHSHVTAVAEDATD